MQPLQERNFVWKQISRWNERIHTFCSNTKSWNVASIREGCWTLKDICGVTLADSHCSPILQLFWSHPTPIVPNSNGIRFQSDCNFLHCIVSHCLNRIIHNFRNCFWKWKKQRNLKLLVLVCWSTSRSILQHKTVQFGINFQMSLDIIPGGFRENVFWFEAYQKQHHILRFQLSRECSCWVWCPQQSPDWFAALRFHLFSTPAKYHHSSC